MGNVAVRHDPASAAVARHAVDEELTRLGIARTCIDDVVLVLSEIVGNAVAHTTGHDHPIDIVWQVEDSAVVLWVHDDSAVLPEQRDVSEYDVSGRGLTIIAAVATEWGVERVADGKRVWARIATAAA